LSHNAQAQAMFQAHAPGKWLADLAGLARQRLAVLGVSEVFGNDSSAGWCTYSQPSRFFSHRRDRVSGRFAVSIWRSG
jgi:copper oxidase (laccase) domain-containing protein